MGVKGGGSWGNKEGSSEPLDLMVLGEVIVKHYLYLTAREEKIDFKDQLLTSFYISPAPRFMDDLSAFKEMLQHSSTLYNDILLFTMGIVGDLVTPELYFEKLLSEYNRTIKCLPEYEVLQVNIHPMDYVDCVLFALRFYIDQVDLIAPTEEPKEGKKS